MKFHADGTLPDDPKSIFVFGSNLRGVHGAGAAKVALEKFGAQPWYGIGLMGRSYAIPTKDHAINKARAEWIADACNQRLKRETDR